MKGGRREKSCFVLSMSMVGKTLKIERARMGGRKVGKECTFIIRGSIGERKEEEKTERR